jgi:hypothetical protein
MQKENEKQPEVFRWQEDHDSKLFFGGSPYLGKAEDYHQKAIFCLLMAKKKKGIHDAELKASKLSLILEYADLLTGVYIQ